MSAPDHISLLYFLTTSIACLWNVRLNLPQTVGGVFIERLADYLLVKSVFGFSLAWDGDSGVYLKMSEEHHGTPCGLCGNFNHIAGDDLTTSLGKTGPDWPLRLLSPLSASTWLNYYNYTLNTEPSQLFLAGALKESVLDSWRDLGFLIVIARRGSFFLR